MNRRSKLDVPHITHPCTESWEAMPGTAQVRHCAVCQKDVVNLAAMSAAAINTLMAGPLPCMRIARYDDGSLVTLEPPAPASRAPRIAAGVLTAAMTFASAVAQAGCSSQPQVSVGTAPIKPVTVSGYVKDHAGQPIAHLHVKLLQDGKLIREWTAAADGRFTLEAPAGNYLLALEGEDIESQTLPLTVAQSVELKQPIEVERKPAAAQKQLSSPQPAETAHASQDRPAAVTPKAPEPAVRIQMVELGTVVVTAGSNEIPLQTPPVALLPLKR